MVISKITGRCSNHLVLGVLIYFGSPKYINNNIIRAIILTGKVPNCQLGLFQFESEMARINVLLSLFLFKR